MILLYFQPKLWFSILDKYVGKTLLFKEPNIEEASIFLRPNQIMCLLKFYVFSSYCHSHSNISYAS